MHNVNTSSFGLKLGEGNSTIRVLGAFREGSDISKLHFRISNEKGEIEILPHNKVVSRDPLALILFYENNIKVTTAE